MVDVPSLFALTMRIRAASVVRRSTAASAHFPRCKSEAPIRGADQRIAVLEPRRASMYVQDAQLQPRGLCVLPRGARRCGVRAHHRGGDLSSVATARTCFAHSAIASRSCTRPVKRCLHVESSRRAMV